jgi:hypothetical protein
MLTFYIDYRLSASGDYEVHHGACVDLPDRNHLIYLGRHDSVADAFHFGRSIFPNLRVCQVCCANGSRDSRSVHPAYHDSPTQPASDLHIQ